MKKHGEVMARAKSLIGLPYVWARDFGFSLGSTVNPSNVAYWHRTDPTHFSNSKVALLLRPVYANKLGGDCSGLITYSCGIPKIGSAQLWELCENKHYFDQSKPLANQVPKDEAVVVYRIGHIGLSCGDGTVVESGSTEFGVGHVSIDEPQTKKKWLGYGYLRKYIDYSEEEDDMTLKLGDAGDEVVALKLNFNSINYHLELSNVFDTMLDNAVRYEQKQNGLPPTGIVDTAFRLKMAQMIYNKVTKK